VEIVEIWLNKSRFLIKTVLLNDCCFEIKEIIRTIVRQSSSF